MRLPYTVIDAFASRPFTGNPAAVMRLDAWLPDELLQSIAAEHNLAETAFLVARPDGDDDLRWFTPAVEVDLCGHATLASGHFVLADPACDIARFHTRVHGALEVRRDGAALAVSLPALHLAEAEPDEQVATALGAQPEALLRDPRGYLLAVFADAVTVRCLAADMRAVARLPEMTVIATAPGDTTDIISRVFVPAGGIDEDPVTGSAHAALTPYWTRRLGRPTFTAHQASARGGDLSCRLDGDRVVLTGRCVTVMEGVMQL